MSPLRNSTSNNNNSTNTNNTTSNTINNNNCNNNNNNGSLFMDYNDSDLILPSSSSVKSKRPSRSCLKPGGESSFSGSTLPIINEGMCVFI